MSLRQLIEWHKKNHLPFISVISTYTQKIISSEGTFVFMRGYKGQKCFIAYTMIKRDVKNNNLPQIKENELRYFQTALQAIYLDEIRSTDIKSAYANILFNDKVISEKTFNYLCTLPKPDRLASVGMLASRNTTYYFNSKGEIERVDKFTSPYSNVFFYAVRKTYYIMNECKHAIKNDFLFSWVDCIYYPTVTAGNIVAECLQDHNLKFTDGVLKEFECKEKPDVFKISYIKDEKFKAFFVPKINNKIAMI
jgi:hypothetical protein